ncbi:nuclear transport factor 2 family protein [Mycobacterium sp. 1423905.2]|uniref:nuclear transport factor 2 family protein n=1 Tax=Mycobacterium sp. 1423905.2 TaxID=1856859 RepID=UPI0009F653B0
MEIWELIAREQIRDTLARYNWSGDSGQLDRLVATFCRDGVLEIRGMPTLQGRSEILAFLTGVTKNVASTATTTAVVRHNVANLLFDDVTPGRAHVSSYFTVTTHIGLDHFGRYRDTLVPDGGTWLIQHRQVTTDWAAPESTMARR